MKYINLILDSCLYFSIMLGLYCLTCKCIFIIRDNYTSSDSSKQKHLFSFLMTAGCISAFAWGAYLTRKFFTNCNEVVEFVTVVCTFYGFCTLAFFGIMFLENTREKKREKIGKKIVRTEIKSQNDKRKMLERRLVHERG